MFLSSVSIYLFYDHDHHVLFALFLDRGRWKSAGAQGVFAVIVTTWGEKRTSAPISVWGVDSWDSFC